MYQVLVLFVLKLEMFILKNKNIATSTSSLFLVYQFQRYEHHQPQVDAAYLQIKCDLQVKHTKPSLGECHAQPQKFLINRASGVGVAAISSTHEPGSNSDNGTKHIPPYNPISFSFLNPSILTNIATTNRPFPAPSTI